jgi:signal peptidase I
MFSFLLPQSVRARRDARNWLQVADKVYHFRRDQLTESETAELTLRRDELKAKIKSKADAAQLKLAVEALEQTLHRTGGRVYPKGDIADNVEFFLAASIVILGLRAFFVQPFKIPTNSMWPTYFGMKHEVFVEPAKAPGPLAQVFRMATLGATRCEAVSPVSGEVRIPYGVRRIINARGEEQTIVGLPYSTVQGRKFFVIPEEQKEYHFLVGNDDVLRVRVPVDFDMDTMIGETFLGAYGKIDGRQALHEAGGAALRGAGGRPDVSIRSMISGQGDNWRCVALKTGHMVKAGEPGISFDIFTGDMLFVDRFSNHFCRPKVGEGFVFRTNHIAGINADQYYIKRLVGTPGDKLEVRGATLYRNGNPITGAEAFDDNSNRKGLYRGYQAVGLLADGQTLTVGENQYFAIGDNSYNSLDSRYWGFVPDKDAVGRPLFIYYPFTSRWGPTK